MTERGVGSAVLSRCSCVRNALGRGREGGLWLTKHGSWESILAW